MYKENTQFFKSTMVTVLLSIACCASSCLVLEAHVSSSHTSNSVIQDKKTSTFLSAGKNYFFMSVCWHTFTPLSVLVRLHPVQTSFCLSVRQTQPVWQKPKHCSTSHHLSVQQVFGLCVCVCVRCAIVCQGKAQR